jgi:hypothetical protein
MARNRWARARGDEPRMDRRSDPDYLNCACGKIGYLSAARAKKANGWATWRFRIYWCQIGKTWHVTNTSKR